MGEQVRTYLVLISVLLSLMGCAKDSSTGSVVDVKTTFAVAKFEHSSPDMTVNLTGAHTGFGDITGPLWITLDFHQMYPDRSISLILDDYAYNVLKKLYAFNQLQELNHLLKMEFISPEQAKGIESTRFIFELFSGARNQAFQKNYPFFGDNTLRVISDPMHGSSKDYIENKNGQRLYFNPPGIGQDRSGIIDNPDLKFFLNKTAQSRRLEAEKHFQNGIIRSIILRTQYPEAKLSFLYGAHNTESEAYLRGQTVNYLNAVKRINSPDHPLIVFTPNQTDVLKRLVTPEYEVYTPETLEGISRLENQVYLVSIGAVSNLQFTSLLAITDVPLIVEGNSAVSTALRLVRPFVMYRSPWNYPQVNGIAHLEKNLDTSRFGDIYGVEPKKVPEFENFLLGLVSSFQQEIYIKALDVHLPNFSTRLASYIQYFGNLKNLDAIPDIKSREASYLTKVEEIDRLYKDPTLEYSLVFLAWERGAVSQQFLAKEEQKLRDRGLDPSALRVDFKVKDGLK